MKQKRTISFSIMVMTVLSALFATYQLARAVPSARPLLQSGAPQVVSYQGQVTVDGAAYSGAGYFKFAVVNAAGDTTYWANDGTAAGEPATAVQLSVVNGLFNVLLGDTTFTTSTVTRTGITELSDWAVGGEVGPTAVSLSNFSAGSQVGWVGLLVGLVGVWGTAVLWRRRK